MLLSLGREVPVTLPLPSNEDLGSLRALESARTRELCGVTVVELAEQIIRDARRQQLTAGISRLSALLRDAQRRLAHAENRGSQKAITAAGEAVRRLRESKKATARDLVVFIHDAAVQVAQSRLMRARLSLQLRRLRAQINERMT